MTRAATPFAHQATCVALEGRGVLVEGPSGSGKSTLALTLIDRGARLVGDDSVMLEARDGRLVARPHPNTRGLIEVRNLGLIPRACLEEAPLCLAITLDPQAPRYIEEPQTRELGGVALPQVQLWPEGPANALKVELALQRFGIGR